MRVWTACFLAAFFLCMAGCTSFSWFSSSSSSSVNHHSSKSVTRGYCEISGESPVNDFLPLMDEIQATMGDMQEILGLSELSAPTRIHIYASQYELEKEIRKRSRLLPYRRAYFFDDSKGKELCILVKHTDYIAYDLRHECTHAFIHSHCPDAPLWLDEGLAEYFEPTRTEQGYQPRHINRLMRMVNTSQWKPNLNRLNKLDKSVVYDLTVEQYAESWLWAHFLINYSDQSRLLLKSWLKDYENLETPPPLSEQLLKLYPDCEERVYKYLLELNRKLAELGEIDTLPPEGELPSAVDVVN